MILTPTGFDDFIPEERPQVRVTSGYGNTSELEVHVEWTDMGTLLAQGWFRVADLQAIIDTAKLHYENGTHF